MEGLIEGRIVHYVVGESDVEQIKHIKGEAHARGDKSVSCNTPTAGEHLPMMITRVWNKETGYVNGKVFLDGNFDYWATSRNFSAEPQSATWHWIEKA